MRDGIVGDNDVMKLKVDWGLQVLDLEGTQVTDKCLSHLEQLASLKYVVLRRTAVSSEAIQQLAHILPKARIWV